MTGSLCAYICGRVRHELAEDLALWQFRVGGLHLTDHFAAGGEQRYQGGLTGCALGETKMEHVK